MDVDGAGKILLDASGVWMGLTATIGLAWLWSKNPRWEASARGAAIGTFLLMTEAVIALEYLLLSRNYQVMAVFNHTDATLPLLFRIGSFWGGDSGSLLLWSWLLSGYMLMATCTGKRSRPSLTVLQLAIMGALGFFFVGVDRIAADPNRD